jgi:hypothetical protein
MRHVLRLAAAHSMPHAWAAAPFRNESCNVTSSYARTVGPCSEALPRRLAWLLHQPLSHDDDEYDGGRYRNSRAEDVVIGR